jgi:hypothetical protein
MFDRLHIHSFQTHSKDLTSETLKISLVRPVQRDRPKVISDTRAKFCSWVLKLKQADWSCLCFESKQGKIFKLKLSLYVAFWGNEIR